MRYGCLGCQATGQVLIILVDTREQLPYWTGLDCARLGLCVGDYTTVDLFNQTHIERKSAADWYGTLTHNFRRFRKEILRARERNIRLVVLVEITEDRFYKKLFPRGDRLLRSGESLRQQVATLRKKYGLQIFWAKDRQAAKRKCYEILRKRTKTKENRKGTP